MLVLTVTQKSGRAAHIVQASLLVATGLLQAILIGSNSAGV